MMPYVGRRRAPEWSIFLDIYYTIKSKLNGMCMDVSDASTGNGAAIIQWPDGGNSANQKWMLFKVQ